MLQKLRKDLKKLANSKKAKLLSGFFKTGKGEYGEGDIFLGIIVPDARKIVKKYYKDICLIELQELVSSKFHEERLTALLILVEKYKVENKKEIFEFYIKNLKYINNWDLVDVTSPRIVGEYLLDKDKSVLYKLSKSKDLWEKRVSIISTLRFIKDNSFKDTLKISEILLNDKHDLIHKAVGWMLREVGKKDQKTEEEFLKKYYKQMPRTMLRYAIERFSQEKREFYMKK